MHWEYRNGCDLRECKGKCFWFGKCKGGTWPHWRQVREGKSESTAEIVHTSAVLWRSNHRNNLLILLT